MRKVCGSGQGSVTMTTLPLNRRKISTILTVAHIAPKPTHENQKRTHNTLRNATRRLPRHHQQHQNKALASSKTKSRFSLIHYVDYLNE